MGEKYILSEDAVETIRLNGVYGEGYSDSEREDDVVDMIESVPGYTPSEIMARQWISVDDDLPKPGDVVIVFGDGRTWDVGKFQGVHDGDRTKWLWKKNVINTVLWWMPKNMIPLPSAQREER